MAKHTPPDDNSFALSLLKHGGAAVALVLVVAAAFWGVGQIDDSGEPVAAGQQTTEPEITGTTAPPATTTPTGTATTPDATPTETATTPPPATPTETATSEPPASQAVDPASVSVQVLDAVLDDAGVGAQGWADQLEADGYRVIVVNKASVRYERTTVFYTPGNEAAARQIAQQYGFSEVALRPDNLSDSVSIHLVVGADA